MTTYDFLLIFAREHWFLTWCALWLLWGVWFLAMAAVRFPLIVVSRLYRTIMVTARGWPPAHLDADGDWKPEPKVVERTETDAIGDMSHTVSTRKGPPQRVDGRGGYEPIKPSFN